MWTFSCAVFIFYFIIVVKYSSATWKMQVIKSNPCDLKESEMDPSRKVNFSLSYRSVAGKKLASSNLTVGHEIGPMYMNITYYKLLPKKKTPIYMNNEIYDCRFIANKILTAIMNVKIDQNCMLKPGDYKLKDFDINRLARYFVVSRTFEGRIFYLVRFMTKKGVVFCFELVLKPEETFEARG